MQVIVSSVGGKGEEATPHYITLMHCTTLHTVRTALLKVHSTEACNGGCTKLQDAEHRFLNWDAWQLALHKRNEMPLKQTSQSIKKNIQKHV